MDKIFFETSLTRVHDWVKAADAKVSIWIAFQGILTAVISPYVSTKIIPIITKVHWSVSGTFAISLILFCISFIESISAITPRLNIAKSATKSLVYFGHIALMGFAEYDQKLSQYDEAKYILDLKQQIHISSQIALRKHREFRFSILFFFISILLFIPMFIYSTL